MTDSTRSTGYVKWFNKKQGFGFIHVLNGEMKGKDIFVHYTSIREKDKSESGSLRAPPHSLAERKNFQQYKYLIQGEYIEFVIEKASRENHKYHATDITGILENNILCETQYTNRVSHTHSPNICENIQI